MHANGSDEGIAVEIAFDAHSAFALVERASKRGGALALIVRSETRLAAKQIDAAQDVGGDWIQFLHAVRA